MIKNMEELPNRKLEVAIFDQDGTLYPSSSELGRRVSLLTKNWLLEVVHPRIVSFEEFRTHNPNFTEALSNHGISLDDWHRDVCDRVAGEVSQLIQPRKALIEFLGRVADRRFLVTLSSQSFTRALIETLGIEQLFEEVINLTCSNKGMAYQLILGKTSSAPAKVGVFGDNKDIDLKPGEALGCRAFYVNPAQDITDQKLIS